MAARLLALAWLASSGHVGLDGPTYAPTSPNVLGCDDLCVGFRCATYSAQSCAVVLEDFGCACAGCACAAHPPGNGSNATGPGDLAPSPACGPRLARDCGACGACFAHGPGRCEASGAMPAPGCASCPACAACFPASRCASARAAAAVAVAAPAWMLRPKHANCSDGDAKARHPEACAAYADARTCCEARAREGWCGGHFSDRGAYAGACRWTCGLCEAGRVDYAHLGRVLGPTEDVRRDIYARGRAKWVLADYPVHAPRLAGRLRDGHGQGHGPLLRVRAPRLPLRRAVLPVAVPRALRAARPPRLGLPGLRRGQRRADAGRQVRRLRRGAAPRGAALLQARAHPRRHDLRPRARVNRRVPDGAGNESDIPSFKGPYLGRFPLVSADFWTSDHLSKRSRSVDDFPGTRARGTLTLKRH